MTAAPYARRLDEILSDGGWHTVDELVAQVGPLIPEADALRISERERTQKQQARGHNTARQRGDRATAVAAGRRRRIVSALSKRRRHGHATSRTNPDGTTSWRAAP